MKSVLRNVIRPVIGKSSGGNWTPASLGGKGLYWGKISEILGGEMPNKITGATDHIDIGGAAGSYTFRVPNTVPYQNADTDYIWFKTDVSQRTTTEAELIGYDFPRTPVKYDSAAPFTIREIVILNAGATLTTSELNHLHTYMQLHIFWSGVWNDYGCYKDNRGLAQQLWTPESLYDAASIDLFARLLVKGETPTDARKIAIDTAIKALKSAGLFATQWDVLVVTRGKGAYTTKENWIKNSSHALGVNAPTYTEDVGYSSDGTSYLRTNYTQNTNAVLLTQNDASFLIKGSGAINANGAVNGAPGTNCTSYYPGINRMNSATNPYGTKVWAVGYCCMSRSSATEFNEMNNAATQTTGTINSVFPGVVESFILASNVNGVPYIESTPQVNELYAFGKAITQAKFLEFQTIMNTYIASL